MSFIGNYSYEERKRPKAGIQRCVILGASEGVSRGGKQMITINLRVSESGTQVKYWLVEGEKFNQRASEFFDAFPEIEGGNFTYVEWVGCEGAADFKFDEKGYLAVKWFISASEAENLPEFVGEKPPRQKVTQLGGAQFADEGSADDFPF